MNVFTHNQIVSDRSGNRFRVFDQVAEVVNVESVVTKELFTLRASELSAIQA